MTDNNTAEFNREGQNAFETEEEKDNSTDSPSEETTTDEDPSPEGEDENTQDDPDKDKPFHEHPRWKQREEEWQQRFNDSELRHQEDLRKIREEFADARKDNKEQTAIPKWFGGSQEQWDEYRADRDRELAEIETRAIDRIKGEKKTEDNAVKEANEYFASEVAAIQADKTLNPTGAKVNAEKLLKTVLEENLVDNKGKWNYRAAFKIMNGQPAPAKPAPKVNEDRKKLASTTTSESKGESKPAAFKTTADFKKSRPW